MVCYIFLEKNQTIFVLSFSEKLALYLSFESGSLDDAILEMLPRFRNLQVFESSDVIRQFETILRICRMQIDRTLSEWF